VVAVYRDIPVPFRPYCIYTQRDGNFVFPARSCSIFMPALLSLSLSLPLSRPSPADGNANSLTSIIRTSTLRLDILPRRIQRH